MCILCHRTTFTATKSVFTGFSNPMSIWSLVAMIRWKNRSSLLSMSRLLSCEMWNGNICGNNAEDIRVCPPMSRWPRRPTSRWAVDKLIASPTMMSALTHSPSALSPPSAIQTERWTSFSIHQMWSILAYAKDLFTCVHCPSPLDCAQPMA